MFYDNTATNRFHTVGRYTISDSDTDWDQCSDHRWCIADCRWL